MTTLKQRFEDRFTEEKQPIGNYSGTFLDWKEHVVPLEVLEFISSECERARGEASEETLRKILVLMSKWQGASQAIYSGAVDEINQIFASLTHTKL